MKRPKLIPQWLWLIGSLIAWLVVGVGLLTVIELAYGLIQPIVNHANLPAGLIAPTIDWATIRDTAILEIAMLWLFKYLLDKRDNKMDELIQELRTLTGLMKAREEQDKGS